MYPVLIFCSSFYMMREINFLSSFLVTLNVLKMILCFSKRDSGQLFEKLTCIFICLNLAYSYLILFILCRSLPYEWVLRQSYSCEVAAETLQSNSLCLLGIHPSLVWLMTLFAGPWPFRPCPAMDRDSSFAQARPYSASILVLSRSKNTWGVSYPAMSEIQVRHIYEI